MANKVTHYERRVYNISDLIGDIGGINQIATVLIAFLLKMYSNKLYEFFSVSEFNLIKPNLSHSSISIYDESENKRSAANKRQIKHQKDDIKIERNTKFIEDAISNAPMIKESTPKNPISDINTRLNQQK